jgi:hypothetical protein
MEAATHSTNHMARVRMEAVSLVQDRHAQLRQGPTVPLTLSRQVCKVSLLWSLLAGTY